MNYTCIRVYGHLLADELMQAVESDRNFSGNRDADFRLDVPLQQVLDYAWSAARRDWDYYKFSKNSTDQYGTRRSRKFAERLLASLDYELDRQNKYLETGSGKTYEITYLCRNLGNLPVIAIGEGDEDKAGHGKEHCSLDYREKGSRKNKSAHAQMLEYLNSTEGIYGIITNGPILRLIRSSGQLVKQTFIEFDIGRMFDEDKYAEFCLMFRLMHASRFIKEGDAPSIFENYFTQSIESGNRIRSGLSQAAQNAMQAIGDGILGEEGVGNDALRKALDSGELNEHDFNKELIRLIYRLLFLFIIEDRGLIYDHDTSDPEVLRLRQIYYKYYSASRFRAGSENIHDDAQRYADLWPSLMETFRIFEDENFGGKLTIKPLGGMLFNSDTLHWLKQCTVKNDVFAKAFRYLNVFKDDRGQNVRINYSSLDVEEFGSVYEGLLELKPCIDKESTKWSFNYTEGFDRKSTSSYYTRPDLVQSLIKTTLEPVIEEKIKAHSDPEEKIKSLLEMKVCDPACGSGHFVLAMARTIALYISRIRSGEDNPASAAYRNTLHEVIQKCVYAVDLNPDAVELCKVVLWIEGYCAGKPLSFLDHHIRCGNSVAGVADLKTLLKGVPDKAFGATDKKVLKKIKQLNAAGRSQLEAQAESETGMQEELFENSAIKPINQEQLSLAADVRKINSLPDNTVEDEDRKRQAWQDLMQSKRICGLRLACDIYCCAFFHEFTNDDFSQSADTDPKTFTELPCTQTVNQALSAVTTNNEPSSALLSLEFKKRVTDAAQTNKFFHWPVEFPEVFADDNGFDVMCGNPPWDKIKVAEKKWFEHHGENDIAQTDKAATRKAKISALKDSNPQLYAQYQNALAFAEAYSRFLRFSGRFKLTAKGDIDLYPLFAELCRNFTGQSWGLVLPLGIANSSANKDFFAALTDNNELVSIFGFENREKLFEIDCRIQFCLLTAGKAQSQPRTIEAGFYLTRFEHLLDPKRKYKLTPSDLALLNPNTHTIAACRTAYDEELLSKIYSNCGHVLLNQKSNDNPWRINHYRMFDMTNDSDIFRTFEQLQDEEGASPKGDSFILPDGTVYVPLYEGKMVWQYNHHFSKFPKSRKRPSTTALILEEELRDPNSSVTPWYWIPQKEVCSYKEQKGINQSCVLVFRSISNPTNERTFISALVPSSFGFGNSAPFLISDYDCLTCLPFFAQLNSILFDYIVRQKISGENMNSIYLYQFPTMTPDKIPEKFKWALSSRVIRLSYFNHDMDAWAQEICKKLTPQQQQELPELESCTPYVFDSDKRAELQAEIDAIIFHLYGLNTREMEYVIDPEDVCGAGCINETFRVLKKNEISAFGEFKTKKLITKAWHKFGFN